MFREGFSQHIWDPSPSYCPQKYIPWRTLPYLAAGKQKITEVGKRGRLPAQPSPAAGRAGRCCWPHLQMDNAVQRSLCMVGSMTSSKSASGSAQGRRCSEVEPGKALDTKPSIFTPRCFSLLEPHNNSMRLLRTRYQEPHPRVPKPPVQERVFLGTSRHRYLPSCVAVTCIKPRRCET